MIKKILTILVLLLMIVFNGCKETVNEPCGDDIKITIVALYDDCNGNWLPAEESKIVVTQKKDNEVLTIASGETVKGRFTFTQGGCGASNLNILASYENNNTLPASIRIDYICSDAIINIYMPCDTLPPTTCNAPGRPDTLIYIDENSGNDCIPIGTILRSQSVTYINKTENNIIIENISGIINYNQRLDNGNKFRFISSIPSLNEITGDRLVLKTGESLSLFFEVITDKIGDFTDILTLPVYCESNPSAKANWDIVLIAQVCPTPCGCPFSTTLVPFRAGHRDAESLKIGETKEFNNVEVMKIDSKALQDGCYMIINEIVRIDTNGAEYSTRGWINDPYQINASNPEDDWTILRRGPYNDKISKGGSLKLNVRVGQVNRAGFLRDTFKLKTTIYDKNNAVIDANCEYKFYLEGRGCEDVCPELVVFNSSKVIINEVNTTNLTDIWNTSQWVNPRRITSNEAIPLGSYYKNDEIFCDFETSPSPDDVCGRATNATEIQFKLQLPQDLVSCISTQKYQFELLRPYPNFNDPNVSIDKDYFTLKPGPTVTLTNDNSVLVSVVFTPPKMSAWSAMKLNDPNKEFFRFRLGIRDAEDNKDCHIVINVRAKVNQFPEISPVRLLYAYNQTTSLQKNPKYMAIKIDEKNTDGFWGADKNFVSGTGNAPLTDATFFINVVNPGSNQIGQAPLLNLVPSALNSFKYISDGPIINYLNNDIFESEYGNLINNILFNSNNCFIPPNPRRENISFNGTNGMNVAPGDVFVVWSDSGYGTCPNPCQLALIFIDQVSNGGDAPNTNGVSNIHYEIVYPIYK